MDIGNHGEWMDPAPEADWQPWLMPQERGEGVWRLLLRWLLTRLPR